MVVMEAYWQAFFTRGKILLELLGPHFHIEQLVEEYAWEHIHDPHCLVASKMSEVKKKKKTSLYNIKNNPGKKTSLERLATAYVMHSRW